MGKFKYYVKSARLRTLPLSLAGIITGVGLAVSNYHVKWEVAVLVALTACLLQILSNVSNEYGDNILGTDREDRQGPKYSDGHLTGTDFKRMIVIYSIASCISGLAMIWCAYGTFLKLEPIMLIILGGFAVMAAIRYTVGRNPYGYRGLGDISVFIFFGLATVLGSYFILAGEIPSAYLLLPASAIGFFSVGVLNINNIRDMETDAQTRTTVAIRLGETWAKIYQTVLIVGGWAMLLGYVFGCRLFTPWYLLCICPLPVFIAHLVGLWRHSGKELDRYLPMLVMGTFFLSICIAVSFTVYLW